MNIQFECLEMSKYLKENYENYISKIIFSIRSGTIDIKKLKKLKYDNNLCVMCDLKEEKTNHVIECIEYGNYDETINLNDIYTQDTEK